MKNILIMGCGELGSRHLQGLLQSRNDLNIVVYDTFDKSLQLAMQRAEEVENRFNNKMIHYSNKSQSLESSWDLVILATTAETRLKALRSLYDCSSIKSLILEKLLTQSVDDLIEMQSLIGSKINTWVNCPRRHMKVYKNIKQYIRQNLGTTCRSIEVNIGYSELVTNAIHFLDLHAWLNDTEIAQICSERLGTWLPSKRKNNFDTSGLLKATYLDHSQLIINCEECPVETNLSFNTEEGCIVFNEIRALWNDLDDKENHGGLELQSTMTGSIADNILHDPGNINISLPTFQQIYKTHVLMLEVFRDHWNTSSNKNLQAIPIT